MHRITDESFNADHDPYIHRESLLDYERLSRSASISRAILTFADESVLIRNAFQWMLDGEPIPDADARMDLDQVCEPRGWKIVERYGKHIAIVSRT
ncbi:MAG TPA: hypothetical protein VLO11_13845 [Luteolibacter sp.]|nr:hypothetical protein [Luteolibacter sp.]